MWSSLWILQNWTVLLMSKLFIMQQSSMQQVKDQFTQFINCTIYLCIYSTVVLNGRLENMFIMLITDCTNNTLWACVTVKPRYWLSFLYVHCYLSPSVSFCRGLCSSTRGRFMYGTSTTSLLQLHLNELRSLHLWRVWWKPEQL